VYLDAKVAPGTVHFGDIRPRVGDRVVFLAVVHARDAVESSDGVDEPVVCNDADSTASVAHWSDHRPLTSLRVETFGRVETFLTVETARYEHLVYASTTTLYSVLVAASCLPFKDMGGAIGAVADPGERR